VLVDGEGRFHHTYDEFLRSPLWRRRRDAWIRKDGPFCRACGRKGLLDVHHLEHVEGMLGNEPDSVLIALCQGRRCHFTAHRYFESGGYESMRAATEAFIRDSWNHRRKAKARRRLVRRTLLRVFRW
jgi:hypothetical protein